MATPVDKPISRCWDILDSVWVPKVAGKAEGIARMEIGASDDEDGLLVSLWLLIWTKTDAVGLVLASLRLWTLVWVETDVVVVVGVLGSGWGSSAKSGICHSLS